MPKLKGILILCCISLSLISGCSTTGSVGNDTTTTTTTATTTTTTATSSEKTDADEKPANFTGPFGETVTIDDEDYDKNLVTISYDDHAYFSFNDADAVAYEVGDTLNNLKLKSAYALYWVSVKDKTAVIEDTRAEFEGEFTIKGYIRANVTDEYQDKLEEPGMILFVPDKNDWASFPDLRRTTRTDDFGFWDTGKGVPGFSLGLLSDYETDLSAIPSDGSEAYVEITLDDLFLIKSDNDIYNTARIISLKTAE